jgi:hypothetical protein
MRPSSGSLEGTRPGELAHLIPSASPQPVGGSTAHRSRGVNAGVAAGTALGVNAAARPSMALRPGRKAVTVDVSRRG